MECSFSHLLSGSFSFTAYFKQPKNRRRWRLLSALMLLTSLHPLSLPATYAATIQNSQEVTSTSAASYAVASTVPQSPNSIIAAFGTQLARATEAAASQPLPLTLAATTVTVRDSAGTSRQAPLFFVSAFQVNYLIPEGTASGTAQVTITSTLLNNDQVISRGTLRVASTGPAIFAANANGSGVPAALTGRLNASGVFNFDSQPPFEPDAANPGLLQPRPVDPGTDAQPAFLILYGTGLRNAPAGTVRVIIGGIEVIPDFIGVTPGFTGLDQVNVRIPTALRGRGRVDFSVVANGIASNSLTINIAGTTGTPPSITSFSINNGALAGQTLTINGSGFSTDMTRNIVRFGNAQARVISATATQMSIIVPFGAESGQVTLQTPQGEARTSSSFSVKTSISGIVQTTGTASTLPVPMENVTLRVLEDNISVRTSRQGVFIIPDVRPGQKTIAVDPGTTNSSPPFPSVTLKMNVANNRDNQMAQPVSMQQITGQGIPVGVGGPIAPPEPGRIRKRTPGNPLFASITDGNVTLDIPTGVRVEFPGGKSVGRVNLTKLEKSRLPAISLPSGVYSSTIVQITPIGAQFTPGASLSFPNPDPTRLNAGAKVDFYRYDEDEGKFIKRGTGTVSSDNARVVSDGRIVDEASYWFAAAAGGVTTVAGRVVDTLDFPLPGVKVTVNGRGDTTDENGGFIIPDVATAGGSQIQVEAVLPQQFGTPPRSISAPTQVVEGGVTNVGKIPMSDTNQPGLVLSPFALRISPQATTAAFSVTLTQPAPAGGLSVSLLSLDTSVATVPSSVTIPAGQTTASFNATRRGTGFTVIGATATLNGSAVDGISILVIPQAGPVLSAVTPNIVPVDKFVTISGTGFSGFPENNVAVILRNGTIENIADPDENEIVQDQSGRPALKVRIPSVTNGAAQIAVAVADNLTGIISELSTPLNLTITTNNVGAPVLTSLSPASGKPKDNVTINGSGFSTFPDSNFVIFRQNGLDIDAEVLQASTTQLVVRVPSILISQGSATVFVSTEALDGSESPASNALDFTVTANPVAPTTPTLSSIVNNQTGSASGRDGEFIRVQGANFGLNFFDMETGDPGNSDPFITILLFYQGGQLASFGAPFQVTNSSQFFAEIPSGLRAGQTQITAITFDLESGLISNESSPVTFNITVSSPLIIDEDEPNDSPETATFAPPYSIIQGNADSEDPGDLTVTIPGVVTDYTVQDLFSLSLTQNSNLQLVLDFEQARDLDLFIFNARPNANGGYTIVDYAANASGTRESISRSLPAGDYLIGVACDGPFSLYDLAVTVNNGTLAPPEPLSAASSENITHPARIESFAIRQTKDERIQKQWRPRPLKQQ